MTELVWERKYDDKGRRVAPTRTALPFQTVETINESAADRDRMQDLFVSGRQAEWRNRLIWGDKKYVLPSLLDEFAGKVNLVYIDPPFATGGDFSFAAHVPSDPDESDGDVGVTFVKEPSIIEQKAYRDTWGRGLDGYIKWFHDTVVLLRELLADDGSLYVHLDYHVAHYAKVVLDEVFGAANLRNEIVWKRQTAHSDPKRFGPIHDTLFYFAKSPSAVFNIQHAAYDETYIASHYSLQDPDGRRYQLGDLTARGPRPGLQYTFRGFNPPRGRVWAVLPEKMEELFQEGRIVVTTGGTPRRKRYLDEMPGLVLQDVWTDVPALNSQANEATNYPTQKPTALLERILKASSKEGDLVLDCFCGSGTTAAVAEKLNRRWIACDLGRFAIHTTRKRLLSIPLVKPFVVQNLGKYERQIWQTAEFGESAEASVQKYRQFVLELYHADAISGYLWLHGNKSGRMVHVGGVDAPVTRADVSGMITEFRKATGTGKNAPTRSGIDVLGWDFAFELNETAKQDAELAGINLRLIRIPREVLEKKAVEQGDIKFFELAALSVSVKKKARSITLELTDFIIPLDDVPEDVRKAVTHWEQWIDYWAVDWDNSDDTFHNEWQTYRTRKNKTLERRTTHTYAEPRKYRVVVKVIDILGNDTTKLLPIEVT